MNKQFTATLKKINPIGFIGNHRIIIALIREGQTIFYCNNCKKFHYHGQGKGFRQPHCIFTNQPDYFLIPLTAEQFKRFCITYDAMKRKKIIKLIVDKMNEELDGADLFYTGERR